jgi:uncharacterized protein (DUF1778 family)
MCAFVAHIELMTAVARRPKTQRLVARVSGTDKELLKRAAKLDGRSMATFVLLHAREAAQRIIGERDNIRLDAEQSRRFVASLLAEPRPVPPVLREASRSYRKRVVNPL